MQLYEHEAAFLVTLSVNNQFQKTKIWQSGYLSPGEISWWVYNYTNRNGVAVNRLLFGTANMHNLQPSLRL